MRIGSLFSGYGGLDRAVAQHHYGATVAWHVEFDKHPSAILAHHYADIPNYGDVSAVDWSRVEPVDIITGGFPCQDVSHAGLRRGVHQGTRSGLWFEMARAIDALQPRKVVIENVAGLLGADAACNVEPCPWCVGDEPAGHMRALGAVLADLAEMGFDADWGCVRAADAGAPHGRLRVFIVATARDTAGRREWGIRRPGQPEDVYKTGGTGRASATDARGGQLTRPAVRIDGLPVAGERGSDPDGLTLLPTPAARDHKGPNPNQRTGGVDLPTALLPTPRATRGGSATETTELLLPTPKASDGPNGGPGMRNGRGVADALPGVVMQLLPTPSAADGMGGHLNRSGDRKHEKLLPGIAKDMGTDFGPYTAAIRRWEQVLGRPAPPPTEPGQNGRPRLSPRFVEWMMGLPAGWVTGVDIPRSAQLKALGNGVVPQQAALALALLDGAP